MDRRRNRPVTAHISRFAVPELDELPDDVRDTILAVQREDRLRPGRVPRARPPAGRVPRVRRLQDAMMERESGLTKAEREMVVIATWGVNDSVCRFSRCCGGGIGLRGEPAKSRVLGESSASRNHSFAVSPSTTTSPRPRPI